MGLKRGQIVAVVLVICGALAYLVFSGMQGTMVFYYTVSEVTAQRASLTDTAVRIAGKVVPGSIVVSPSDHLDREFVIHEGGERIRVLYRGIAPDTLVDDADAVVEGRLGEDGVFHATFVMAKCPSKYEGETDMSKYRQAGVSPPAGATSP